MKDHTIGFVGVGRMGANMARHLADLGYSVASLYDIRSDQAQSLAQEINATAADSPAQVAAQADIVFTVVTDDAAMEAAFLAPQTGLLSTPERRTRLFINCATLSPGMHERIAHHCQEAGAASLEAAMASSIPQARNGTLYLMIGGDRDTFESHQSLLDDLSSDLQYIGPAGSASKVKALVNMVMNINTAGLAEGLGLGEALGLDLATLKKVFSQTGANSRVLETDGDDMIQRDHECYFSAAHAAKDSGIANALAQQSGIDVPLSRATEAQYRTLIRAGKGELDKSAIAELTFKNRRAAGPR